MGIQMRALFKECLIKVKQAHIVTYIRLISAICTKCIHWNSTETWVYHVAFLRFEQLGSARSTRVIADIQNWPFASINLYGLSKAC